MGADAAVSMSYVPPCSLSLIDGNYTLTVFSSQVNGRAVVGDQTATLFRLFGDVKGTGQSTAWTWPRSGRRSGRWSATRATWIGWTSMATASSTAPT
jgi:hypothetical protein